MYVQIKEPAWYSSKAGLGPQDGAQGLSRAGVMAYVTRWLALGLQNITA